MRLLGDEDRAYNALVLSMFLDLVLVVSHVAAPMYIGWNDLTGNWKPFSIEKNRSVTFQHYVEGLKSFLVDVFLCGLPVLSFSLYWQYDRVVYSDDPWWFALLKLVVGFNGGRIWAMMAHRILHLPLFYTRFHKRHHCLPTQMVASGAWLDSFVEFLFMETPSFHMMLWFFPTHLSVHVLFFMYHGISAAGDHSGHNFPDEKWFDQFFFDGEVHYMHHKYTTWNYAEVEWLDYLCHTHHTQRPQRGVKCTPKAAALIK